MTSSTVDRRLGLRGELGIKAPVKAAASGNITLSGEQTIDGVSCVDGDRVLVMGQTSGVNNGVYDVSTGTWTRSLDWDGNNDVVHGTIVLVTSGSTNAGQFYELTASDPIIIGTTAQTFALSLTASSSTLSFLQAGTGAVARTLQGKMRDVVSVADFGAVGTSDDSSIIQLAINTGHDVWMPDIGSSYKIGASLTVPTGRKGLVIRGEYLHTKLEATFAGAIISIPSGLTTQYIHLDGLTFQASGAGDGAATGISGNAGLAYVMLSDFTNCQFSGSLRYGFAGNFLQGSFTRCGFGSDRTPTGGKTFKPIKMFGTDVFQTTIRIIDCEINSGNDDYAVDLQFGTDVVIRGGAIEVNTTTTGVIGIKDFNQVFIENLWAETNGAVPLVKTLDGSHAADTRVHFDSSYLQGNGSGANDVIIDTTSCTGKTWSITRSIVGGFTHVSLEGGVYDLANHICMRYGNKSFSSPSNFLENGIGEYVSGSQATLTNFPSSTHYGDGASISLTAGDWDVDAVMTASLNGATITGAPTLGVSTTTGDSSAGLVVGDTTVTTIPPTATAMTTCNINAARFVLTGTTTVYLKVRCDYSAGNPQYRCRISARRRT